MAKGKVRLSNWAMSKLTPLQIKYAALDAYVSTLRTFYAICYLFFV